MKGAKLFCSFSFAALAMKKLSADRDGRQNFLPLSFCGVGDENFLLIEMGGKTFCFFPFAALPMKELFAGRDEGRTLLCSANAAKRKNDKSQAPHLYHAKAISANAAKRKNDKSQAPHLYHAKAISANAAKGKNDKS